MARNALKLLPAMLALGLGAVVAAPQKTAALPEKHKSWLENDVPVIITATERDVFRKLENSEDRDRFIEAFWKQRDPTPGTTRNEFRDEHYRRLEFADRTFKRGMPFQGRKTERGRIYIALGPPMDVQRFENGETYPAELWSYQASPLLGQPAFFRILFYQSGGGGDYKIYNPVGNSPKELVPFANRTSPSQIERAGINSPPGWTEDDILAYRILRDVSQEFAQSTLSNVPGPGGSFGILQSSILLAEVQKYPQKKVDDRYALDFLEHKATVEVSYSVHAMSNWTSLQVYQDPGGVYRLHYAVVPERMSMEAYGDTYFTSWKSTVRLAAADGSTLYQEDKSLPIELHPAEFKAVEKSLFNYYDALPIVPGACTANVLLENTVSKEFTSFSGPISIPAANVLWMTPPLLARQASRIEPAPGGAARGFQVGSLKLVPAANNTIGPREKSFLFLQLHNAGAALRNSGHLDLQIVRDGKTYHSSKRDLAGNTEGLDILEELPTATLPPGLYAVGLSLRDGQDREIWAGRTDLNIAAASVSPAWIFAPPNPPIEDAYYNFALGTQYRYRNDRASASRELALAFQKKPGSLEYGVAYARLLLDEKEFARARSVLFTFVGSKTESFDLYETLGRAAQGEADFKDAIVRYEKALTFKGDVVGVLNALGECHLKTGEPAKARVAWQKSLAIKPNQDAIRKALEEIK